MNEIGRLSPGAPGPSSLPPRRTRPSSPDVAGLPLGEFFERVYVPQFLVGTSPRTLDAYRESLAHWSRVTGNLPLREIDSQRLAEFKASLLEGSQGSQGSRKDAKAQRQLTLFELGGWAAPLRLCVRYKGDPLAAATVNKHLRHLGAILSKAGPPGPRNRDALWAIERVPWTRPVRQYRRMPRKVSDQVLDAIYRAAGIATHPVLDRVDPGHWWKALLVTALTVGFRRGGLFALRWSGVDWEEAEVRLPAEGDKCHAERSKPVCRLVLQHLMRIRSAGPLVFAFPHSESKFYR